MTTLKGTTHKHQSWQKHIFQWQESDLSQAEYCRLNGLKQNSFSYHKLKQSKSTKTISERSTGFISLPLPPALSIDEPLTLRLTNGMILSGIDRSNIVTVKQLAQVLL